MLSLRKTQEGEENVTPQFFSPNATSRNQKRNLPTDRNNPTDKKSVFHLLGCFYPLENFLAFFAKI
jgi:hypothetical protein